jgi:hypothetical protein
MAVTQIRNLQIKDQTIELAKLVSNFLNGSDWNITNGANDATITGLQDGVNPRDAVTKAQLDSLAASVSGGLSYRGGLAAGSDLSGNTTGNAYLDGGAGLEVGDFFYITSSGQITDGTNNLAVNAGDMIIANKDVATDLAIDVSADFDLVDNTESPDILRTGDVIDNLTSTDAAAPLSANQGRVLDQRLVTLENRGIPVWGEVGVVTSGQAAIGNLNNPPVVGSERVYLNGLRMQRGSGNDYQIAGSTVTFEYTLTATDKVLVDYNR